jgi:hypothetical protein
MAGRMVAYGKVDPLQYGAVYIHAQPLPHNGKNGVLDLNKRLPHKKRTRVTRVKHARRSTFDRSRAAGAEATAHAASSALWCAADDYDVLSSRWKWIVEGGRPTYCTSTTMIDRLVAIVSQLAGEPPTMCICTRAHGPLKHIMKYRKCQP